MKTLVSSVLIILFVSCASKKTFLQIPVEKPYDVIIVPGYPHHGEKWEDVMKIRMYWSKYLYDKGYTKNIIYSGGAISSKYVEARIMALYARELGINKEHIHVECEAEHSTENVYNSYQIAREMGWDRIALATDPYQSKNLVIFLKKYDLPIEMIPINFDTMAILDKPEPKINLSSATKENYIPLKNREGFFKRLGGTFGKHIIWNEDDLSKKRQIKRLKRKGRCVVKPVNK